MVRRVALAELRELRRLVRGDAEHLVAGAAQRVEGVGEVAGLLGAARASSRPGRSRRSPCGRAGRRGVTSLAGVGGEGEVGGGVAGGEAVGHGRSSEVRPIRWLAVANHCNNVVVCRPVRGSGRHQLQPVTSGAACTSPTDSSTPRPRSRPASSPRPGSRVALRGARRELDDRTAPMAGPGRDVRLRRPDDELPGRRRHQRPPARRRAGRGAGRAVDRGAVHQRRAAGAGAVHGRRRHHRARHQHHPDGAGRRSGSAGWSSCVLRRCCPSGSRWSRPAAAVAALRQRAGRRRSSSPCSSRSAAPRRSTPAPCSPRWSAGTP